MADIEKATSADVPRLAQTLANAFYDDPAISWMVPDRRSVTAGGSLL